MRRSWRTSWATSGMIAAVLPLLIGAGLPSEGPVPRPAPRPQAEATQPSATAPPPLANDTRPAPVPKPSPQRRETGDPPQAQKEDLRSLASRAPPPPASGSDAAGHAAKDRDLGGTSALHGETAPSSIAPEDPEAHAACITALKAIGARFTVKDRIEEGVQCGIDRPVEVEAVLPDVQLEPKGILRCEAALQLARMTRNLLVPAAEATFPDKPLTAIRQASTYVCRNRNSDQDGKLSEHARGNAIDIAGLSFGDEEMPVMIARQEDGSPQAVFQRAFNALACLYFTTVLSPGSDAPHQDHMHLDVIERKGGFRYCR